MRKMAALFALGLMALASGGAEAQSRTLTLPCGGTYTIQRGDTLQQVTRMAYGEGLSWKYIYRANKGVVGPNPSLVEVGMVLNIPCRKGQTPGVMPKAAAATAAATPAPATPKPETQPEPAAEQTAAVETPAAPETGVQATAVKATTGEFMPNRVPFRIMTGTDWAPFTDADQADGGMITDIVNTAMSRVVPAEDYKIDYIKDWSAHLEPLLSEVAYDFTIPWFKPNCDVIEKLGENSRLRCEKLKFSDPIYEMITGYYVRADDPNPPRTHADLTGRKVCRAQGYATYMLEEYDIRPPLIEYVRPVIWNDCFEMLAAGDVDVLFISTTAADDIIAELGIASQIAEVPELAYVTTMHAVTSINNPRADEQLKIFNEGLRELREDGTWFQIVQKHLVTHAQKTATN